MKRDGSARPPLESLASATNTEAGFSATLLPVERPTAVMRGALCSIGLAGPWALWRADSVVDATREFPHTLIEAAVAAFIVVACGFVSWRARLWALPVLLTLAVTIAAAPASFACSVAYGVVVSAALERGAPSMSTSSRAIQWATTAALGLSLLTATLTMLIAASGSWAPLPWSGAAAVSSRSLLLPGVACVVVGGAIVVWCARFLLAHGGTPDPCAPPQAWCASGPYATTSHPMQRGQLLVLLGLVLLVGTQGAAVVGVVLALVLVGPVRTVEAQAQRDVRQSDDTAPTI